MEFALLIKENFMTGFTRRENFFQGLSNNNLLDFFFTYYIFKVSGSRLLEWFLALMSYQPFKVQNHLKIFIEVTVMFSIVQTITNYWENMEIILEICIRLRLERLLRKIMWS